jgi:hypothetical protein
VESTLVNDHPAAIASTVVTMHREAGSFDVDLPVLRWSPAPGVEAALGTSPSALLAFAANATSPSDVPRASRADLVAIAEQLVVVDQDLWTRRLTSDASGALRSPPLGLPNTLGDVVIDQYSLGEGGANASLIEVLSVPDVSPAPLSLESVQPVPLTMSNAQPVGRVGGNDVYLDPVIRPTAPNKHTLAWTTDESTYFLDIPADVAIDRALAVASSLQPLDHAAWIAMLEPSGIRPDLVSSPSSSFPWFDVADDDD